MSSPVILQNVLVGPGSTDAVESIGHFGVRAATKYLQLGVSSSAATIASSGTITPTTTMMRISNAGAITGVIVAAGTVDGQVLIIVNEGSGSTTMAAAGISNVGIGTACVIAVAGFTVLIWDAAGARWRGGASA